MSHDVIHNTTECAYQFLLHLLGYESQLYFYYALRVVNHEMSHIIHLALHLLSLFFILSFWTTCDSDFWLVSLVMFAHVQLFNSSVLFLPDWVTSWQWRVNQTYILNKT